MSDKKAFLSLLGYIVGVGIVIASFVFCVDPFYHYHDAWFNLPIILDNAVYQTSGAASHLQYDSAIVGTSMTENLHTSWFDEELGWSTMKLSYSGARSDDLHAILEQIYSRDVSPSHIVMDINDYQLTVPSWTAYVERPEYLYDGNILTDAPYLYNYDIIMLAIERIVDGTRGRESNIDIAYTWGNDNSFGSDIVFSNSHSTREKLMESGPEPVDWDEMLQCCDENLSNILPFIELHPETQFYIFYPPYSMLYWEQKMLQGSLWEILEIYRHSIQNFLQYDNVHVYYFQYEPEIITDLDNYMDIAHHRPEYNRYIFECIRDGKNLVTEENLQSYIDSMYEYAENFDYDALWKDFTP